MAQTETAGTLLEWGKRSERVADEELAELTALANKQGCISDYWIAKTIYDIAEANHAEDEKRWQEVTGFAAMFRVGYILGVRRERARRHAATHTHTHTAAAFTSLELPRLEGLPHEFR